MTYNDSMYIRVFWKWIFVMFYRNKELEHLWQMQ